MSMSWQRVIDAGLNAFGMIAFLKSLDRTPLLRFGGFFPSPTENCSGRIWKIYLERDDAPPQRVEIKEGWHEAGKGGRLIGPAFVSEREQPWAAVLWDDEEDPDWFKTAGLIFHKETKGDGL